MIWSKPPKMAVEIDNIIEKYTTDFRLLFKKMLVQENVFYLQRALRDEYQVPIRSLNIMPEIFNKRSQHVDGIKYFTRDTGKLTPGLYFYKIWAVDKFNNVVESDEIKASLTLTVPTGSIHLSWNSIIGTKKYVVYGRTAEFERMWEVTEPEFADDGSNTKSIPTDGIPEIEEYPYTLFPEFTYNNQSFTSPFLYKFNPVFNYYEGWLFYPELLVNFSSVEPTNQGELSAATLPSIFLNLIYDQTEQKTKINLKSYQSINEWNFSITIPELSIYNQSMDMIDESTFTYEYSENHGLIVDPIVITITGNSLGVDIFVAKTARINQRYDITDLLQIPTFTYQRQNYMVDLPVLESEKFQENKVLYLDKMLQFLLGFNFEEKTIFF